MAPEVHQSDHDLLIRLDENVRNLAVEVKNLSSDLVVRIVTLEKNKVEKEDYNALKKDTEDRLRRIERFTYIAIGIAMVAEILIAKFL